MTGMDRLVVVRCPHLLEEDEDGAVLRSFIGVIEATEAYCPWVTVVGLGLCSLPARGPARYFGGEAALARSLTEAVSALTPVEVGVADGLFAALLAARGRLIVPAGATPEFLAPFPLAVLGRPDLAELLDRLGLRTLGDFAALPEAHVLGRFGADGVLCHRVAGGRRGEMDGVRQPEAVRRVDRVRTGARPGTGTGTGTGTDTTGGPPVGEPQFWGGTSEADTRAACALDTVAALLGPDAVVTARLQGGRGPAERARFVTWNARTRAGDDGLGAPWPGRIPPPAPVIVHPTPLAAELADDHGRAVSVSGRGLLTTPPARLSVARGPWSAVTAWAGPWPSDERWWSRSRRRSARLQAVAGADAHLLLAERGRWWVEATYG
jgi:protein ImuB